MWQDVVLTGGTIIFIISLLPSVFSKEKPAILTSLPTGIILLAFVGVYISLSLWLTALLTVVSGTLWLTLAVQKFKKKK